MRSSTWRLEDLRNVILNLGFVGENLHTRQIFDCKKMFDQYPNASVSMTVTPPEGEPYPGTIERDGDLVIWDVRDSDLVAEGDGEIQIVFTQEPHIARSYNARTHICRSQVPTGSIPSGLDDYITRADQLLDQVEDTFPDGGTKGQVLAKKSDTDYDTEWVDQGGGTEDYDELENRPQIGGVTLTGNKTLHDLGAASEAAVEAKYTKPETGIPASDIADGVIPDPEDLIDDTAGDGDTNKVWSADKSSALLTQINSKADEPTGTKFAGKVYGLDSNLAPVWMDQSGGSSDYTDLSNKPQINGVALEGNKTPSQLGLLSGTDVSEAVDDWLQENITNPDSPPLDRSLSASSAATPADIAGSIVNKLEKIEVIGTANKWNKDVANVGVLHTNGNVYTGGAYDSYVYGVSIPVSPGDEVRVFYKVNGSFALGTLSRVASYDSSGTIVPASGGNEVKLYTVPSGIASIRITIMGDYNSTAMVIFNDDTVPSEYIPYQEGYSYYQAGSDFVPELGDLDALETTEKTNLVGAINEVKEQADTTDSILDVETLKSKNLNTAKYQSNTDGGVTFTLNDDGSISLSGTATRDAFFYDGTNPNNRFELPAGEYTLSGGYSSKISIYMNFYVDQTTTTPAISAVYSGASANSFTTDSKYYCSINAYIVNGENTNGITLYPQLEEGGEATDYVSPAEWDESLRLQDIEEDIEELQNEVMGSDLNVPSYYNTNSYLVNKCKRFNTLARQSSGASDSFAFVTDLHWTQNAGKSPSLLRFIKKNTRIDKLFCGGDICDFEEIESRPYDAFSNFVKAWDNQIYTAVGNHEYISQYGTEGRAYYSFNSLGKDRIGNLDRSYFYFDNPQAKIRYIFLSAYKANSGTPASGYEQAQLTWLENVALNLESGWGAIVVTHMTHSVYENASIGQTATDMLNVLDAYDGDGEIICVISGHTHADYYDTTTGGIPIIVTTCDKYMPWISGSTNMEPWLSDRVAGTITEQAIDLFLIDRTAETITKVRVGCPIHYGTDPETWTEYEDVAISYSRE